MQCIVKVLEMITFSLKEESLHSVLATSLLILLYFHFIVLLSPKQAHAVFSLLVPFFLCASITTENEVDPVGCTSTCLDINLEPKIFKI